MAASSTKQNVRAEARLTPLDFITRLPIIESDIAALKLNVNLEVWAHSRSIKLCRAHFYFKS